MIIENSLDQVECGGMSKLDWAIDIVHFMFQAGGRYILKDRQGSFSLASGEKIISSLLLKVKKAGTRAHRDPVREVIEKLENQPVDLAHDNNDSRRPEIGQNLVRLHYTLWSDSPYFLNNTGVTCNICGYTPKVKVLKAAGIELDNYCPQCSQDSIQEEKAKRKKESLRQTFFDQMASRSNCIMQQIASRLR